VLLAWVLRVVDAGPRPFFQAAMVSLAATAVLAIAITLQVRPAGPLSSRPRDVIIICLAALVVVGVLTLVTVLVPARGRALTDRYVAPQQRAAIWLALTSWFPLLAIIAYYRAEATLPPTQVWIAFGFMDKRWETAAYLTGALAPMLLLTIATRVLEAGRAHPATWRSWLRDLAPRRHPGRRIAGQAAATQVAANTVVTGAAAADTVAAPSDAAPSDAGAGEATAGDATPVPAPSPALAVTARRFPGASFVRVTAGLLTALALAYYFYGPPWYLNRTSGSLSLGYQEDLYLGGLQAISKGAVPYIGAAAIQYGPGSQWFSYEFTRHFATFSVVGFRESWAMFEWVGASVLFVVFFLALGYFRGLAATLMAALIYPALHLMEFAPGGAYTGYYGWANPLRYVGAMSLLLLLPAAIRRAPAWRGLLGAVALGLLWGLLSYVAQENLLAGAVGAVVLAALLVFSGSASVRAALSSLLAVLVGFALAWLPVVVFYAGKGLLGRFLYLYFMDPSAVAEGYSNTPYGWPAAGQRPGPVQVAASAPWSHLFHILPFVLAALALLAVLQFRPFRVVMDWSKDRITLVACLVTAILLYQGAMLRSDGAHLAGTELFVPLLVAAVATILPRQLGGRRLATLATAGVVLFASSFLLLPVSAYKFSSIGGQAEAPYLDRQQLAADKAPVTPPTVADERVGAGLWKRSSCCQTLHKSESMSGFIKLMNELHTLVGRRVTYVDSFATGYPGIVYFAADLRPAPVPLDLRTMVFTKQANAVYMATFRRSVLPKVQAIVTNDPLAPEVRAFRLHYAHWEPIRLPFWGPRFWLLLNSPAKLGIPGCKRHPRDPCVARQGVVVPVSRS
jgi:hypothetical protein